MGMVSLFSGYNGDVISFFNHLTIVVSILEDIEVSTFWKLITSLISTHPCIVIVDGIENQLPPSIEYLKCSLILFNTVDDEIIIHTIIIDRNDISRL